MFLISLFSAHQLKRRSEMLGRCSPSAADSANRPIGRRGGAEGWDKGSVGLMRPAWFISQAKRWHKHSLKSNLIASLCNLQLSTSVPLKTSIVRAASVGERLSLQRLLKSSDLRVYLLGLSCSLGNTFYNFQKLWHLLAGCQRLLKTSVLSSCLAQLEDSVSLNTPTHTVLGTF